VEGLLREGDALKKILIVEDHPIVLEVMAALVRSVFPDADIHCSEDCSEAERIAASIGELDLVLLNLGLPGCAGIWSVTRLRDLAPAALVVVVSGHEEKEVILAAFEAGARGYIPKTSKREVICAALRIVAAGSIYVPPQAIAAQSGAEAPAQEPALTERQLDVLRLITRGFANKEIAAQLSIAKDTVKQHAKAVYTALGVANRSQAARVAERRGIKLR
jgi:DNA-binding NarL/FixJ family response regulator